MTPRGSAEFGGSDDGGGFVRGVRGREEEGDACDGFFVFAVERLDGDVKMCGGGC